MYPYFIMALAKIARMTGVNSKEDVKEACRKKKSKERLLAAARTVSMADETGRAFVQNVLFPRLTQKLRASYLAAKAQIEAAPEQQKLLNPRYAYAPQAIPARRDQKYSQGIYQNVSQGFWGDRNNELPLAVGEYDRGDFAPNYVEGSGYNAQNIHQLPRGQYYADDIFQPTAQPQWAYGNWGQGPAAAAA
jgi:hypothetical protein